MKNTITKAIVLGGLCALLAGAAHTASAQGYGDGQDWHHGPNPYYQGQDFQGRFDHAQNRPGFESERRRLEILHAAYDRAAEHGNYAEAERDHEHAEAIRARLRSQEWNHNQFRNDGFDRDGGF
ncbi:MAG: hypothetical protein ACRYFS_14790 [Janthinobacterium lividum]